MVVISLLVLTLHFVCSSLSNCFSYKVNLRFFFFPEISLYTRNFPLRTTFAVSHTFWIIMFSFSFVSIKIISSFDFFSDPVVVS